MNYDFAVLGGGIVGISTAWQLKRRYPRKNVLLLEKEADCSLHQTGHNSGVIHAGVYYQPGSLKAEFCKKGAAETMAFCTAHSIPFQQRGKLLVATNELEVARMQALFANCRKNTIEAELLSAAELHRREPNITGLGAIHVRDTAIVDYKRVAATMAEQFLEIGGVIKLGHEVRGLGESPDGVEISLQNSDGASVITAGFFVSCAGLQADRIVKMLGIPVDFQIIPYRGEYYRLDPRLASVVQHLIYPLPDPNLPFLGIHLTPMIDGSITVGPNAVQGWKREGYGRINVNLRDIKEMLAFSGFWKVLSKHLSSGLIETRNSLWKRGYLRQVQKYCPSITLDDLHPYPAGIRAQAVMRDGSLVHDFLFAESPLTLHVCNAPSPAATSAMPIGRYIVDKIVETTEP